MTEHDTESLGPDDEQSAARHTYGIGSDDEFERDDPSGTLGIDNTDTALSPESADDAQGTIEGSSHSRGPADVDSPQGERREPTDDDAGSSAVTGRAEDPSPPPRDNPSG